MPWFKKDKNNTRLQFVTRQENTITPTNISYLNKVAETRWNATELSLSPSLSGCHPIPNFCMMQTACAHTSLGGLKCLALAGWPLPLVVQHPDGDVVDTVGLQARQAALASVPRER